MSVIEIECTIPDETVACGAAIYVTTTLSNQSNETLEIPITGKGSPFSFELRDRARLDGAPLELSAEAFQQKKHFIIPRAEKTPPATVAPAESYQYREDISRYLLGDITPGDYDLRANYAVGESRYVSAPVRVHIIPLAVHLVSSHYCEKRHAFVSAAICGDGDHQALYQRESIGRDPRETSWIKRAGNFSETPTSVEICLDTGSAGPARWHAWSSGETIGAQQVWGNATTACPPIQSTGGDVLTFIRGAYGVDNDQGLFFAIGRHEGKLYRIEASREGLNVQPFEPPWFSVPRQIFAAYDPRGADAFIHWTWIEEHDGETLVWQSASVVADMSQAKGPMMLCQRKERLLAIATPFLCSDKSRDLHLLWAPSGEDTRLTYAVIRENSSPPLPEVSFVPAPDGYSASSQGQFLIGCTAQADFPVLYSSDGGIQVIRAGQEAQWAVVDEGTGRSPQYFATDRGQEWIQSFDPNAGLTFHKLKAK